MGEVVGHAVGNEDEAINELWESDDADAISEEQRLALFEAGELDDVAPIIEVPAEALELGTYTDFDRLFDVLNLVSEQAMDWEAQLVSFDDDEFEEPDVYDLFGADDGDDIDDDDIDDDDIDGDDDEDFGNEERED